MRGDQTNPAAQPTDQLQLSILAKALKRQAQRFCNADQHKNGHNTISTLDPAKVGPVNFSFKCQLFLRKTLRQPGAAYGFAKCDERGMLTMRGISRHLASLDVS